MRIIELKDLAEGQVVKFPFQREGLNCEGFLANYFGEIRAYENRCRHLPLALDRLKPKFFSEDGRYFLCQNHGALFEPLSGLCVCGPCVGARLFSLAIEVVEGGVWLA
jgi:nitrite reductase/ring-hydroxylating ferredoxin subunit